MSAAGFLERHGMLPDLISPDRELERFLDEMDRVRKKGAGSLKMLPAFLGQYHPASEASEITVMDIGGTNVRAYIASMGPEGLCGVSSLRPFLTPGQDGEIDTKTFFRLIAEELCGQRKWEEAMEKEGSRLGICFSFALKPSGERDAVVAFGAKQINVRDLVGQEIGGNFRMALESLGKAVPSQITVINDASAAALGGRAMKSEKRYGGYLGFIYGTGTNVSYCTRGGEIINVESGAYCSFPAGDIDDEYDRTLIDSGQDRFEKMVSGGYQRGLCDLILRHASEEGEVSGMTYSALHGDGAAALDPKQISAFSKDAAGGGRIAGACSSEQDRRFLLDLFDLLTLRSARLCSVTVTAAMIAARAGESADAPAFITAEGSAFTKQHLFREKLFSEMELLAGKKRGLHYEFHIVPEVILRGTAVACLSG